MSLFSCIEIDAEYNCVIMIILRTALITKEMFAFHFLFVKFTLKIKIKKLWVKNAG